MATKQLLRIAAVCALAGAAAAAPARAQDDEVVGNIVGHVMERVAQALPPGTLPAPAKPPAAAAPEAPRQQAPSPDAPAAPAPAPKQAPVAPAPDPAPALGGGAGSAAPEPAPVPPASGKGGAARAVRDGSVTSAERPRSVVLGGAPHNAGPNSTRADGGRLVVSDGPEKPKRSGAEATAAGQISVDTTRPRGARAGAEASGAASGDAADADAGPAPQGGDPAALATADPVATGAQASDDSTGALPFTGSEVPLLAGFGLLALAVGVALRRTAPARRVSRGGA